MANISGGSIVWILDAETGEFNKALIQAENQAKKSSDGIAATSRSTASKVADSFNSIGTSMSNVGKNMSLYVTAPITAGFAASVKSAGTFESSLSQLKQVSGATAPEMGKLADTARRLGNDSRFAGVTAQDTAKVMIELSKAGLNVNDTLGATEGVLALAKAGNVEFAEAATIAASALNAFSLRGDQATQVADALAAGANASQAELHDLALGMQQSATVAKQFGLSLNENVTALALFANNGIRGSDAGTSLKTMLIRLAKPSDDAAQAMREMGFNAYDAQGQFVGLREMSLRLAKGLSGMTDEQKQATLATIFGTDAFRAAAILADNAGKSYDSMSAAVGKNGAASQAAAAQLGPYERQLENFKNSVSELALTLGERLLPRATETLKGIEKLVDGFGKLDPWLQDAIINVGLFVAAMGPVLFITGKVVSGIGAMIKAYQGLITVLNATKVAFTGLQIGMTGAQVASGGIAGVFSKIGNFIAPAVGIVKGAMGAIVTAVSIGARAIGAAIFSIPVVGWIIAIVTALIAAFTYFYTTSEDFRNFVNGIFSGIGDMITGAFKSVQPFFAGLWKGIMDGAKGIGDFFAGIWNGIVSTLTPVVTTVVNVFKTIGSVVSTVVGTILTVLTPLFQILGLIGHAIFALGQIVFTVFSTIFQVIFTIVSTIVQIIGVILYGTVLKIGQLFTWVFQNIGNIVSTVFTFIAGVFTSVWNGIVAFFTPIINGILAVVTIVFNAMAAVITRVVNGWLTIFKVVWGAISAFLTPIINRIASVISTVFNAVAGTVNRVFNLIKTYIINPISQVVSYVTGTVGRIASAIGGAVGSAYNAVAGFVGRFVSAGHNIIDGIVRGIQNGAGAVVNFIKNVCSNALNAVKNFFGIKSPSKVMAQMGGYLMEGFGIGIDKTSKEAVSAAQSASTNVLGAFQSVASGMGAIQTDFNVVGQMAPAGQDMQAQPLTTSLAGREVVINQTNNVNTDLDMDQVNRNLTWELNKL